MTIHVISVGVSLRDSLANPRDSLKGHAELISLVTDHEPHRLLAGQGIHGGTAASDWIAGALAPASDPGHVPGSAARLAGLCAQVRPDLWPSDLSAELDTFSRASGSGSRLASRDLAILVSSDTDDGLVSGLWNAAAIAGRDLSRLRYLAAPDDSPGDVRGSIVLVRVLGLDAGDEKGFCQAMAGLGVLGRHLFAMTSPGESFRFYLSGGFKAAIPYLIGLAEGLRSLDPSRTVDAWVLHDTTRSAAIRLPLRWLTRQWIKDELAGFSASGTRADKPASPALLEGYAYEKEGRLWRLTPFGEGLRALFGLNPEGLGG